MFLWASSYRGSSAAAADAEVVCICEWDERLWIVFLWSDHMVALIFSEGAIVWSQLHAWD